MRPVKYKVKPGDCISSIAFQHGFFPNTIWKDPANAELKQLRKNPNTLCKGDVLVIPDKRPKVEQKADQLRHRFRRKGVPEKLRLQFTIDGEPLPEEMYTIVVDGKILSSSETTDANGWIEHFIPPNATKAIIRFEEMEGKYEFQLGQLQPIDTIAGVQGRLRSLGLFSGDPDGKPSEDLTNAIYRFQSQHDLPPTGEAESATKAKLEEEYGG